MSKYFRHRLKTPIDPTAERYISSLEEDERIAEIDIKLNEAHVLMLYKQGQLRKHEAKKILEALEFARKLHKFYDFLPIKERIEMILFHKEYFKDIDLDLTKKNLAKHLWLIVKNDKSRTLRLAQSKVSTTRQIP